MSLEGKVNSLKYGSRTIEYKLIYSNRKTLGIVVKPDQSVTVRAPINADSDRIQKIVKKKSPWIVRTIEYFEALLPKLPQRTYVSGESHYYLGKHYRLKVHKSNLEDVRLNKNSIAVYTIHKGKPGVVKTLLQYWYKYKAEKKFRERFDLCFESFNHFRNDAPKLTIRKMKRRWGSCNTKNKITLNEELVKTPTRCIDYVIMHELCHLIYRNHDHQFYTMLSRLMPDWKERKGILEKSVGKI